MLLQPQAPGCEDARANRNLLYVVTIFFITMPSAGTLYLNNYMLLEGLIQIVYLLGRLLYCTKSTLVQNVNNKTIDSSELILHFVER